MEHQPVGKRFELVNEISGLSDRQKKLFVVANIFMFVVVATWLMPVDGWGNFFAEKDRADLIPPVLAIAAVVLAVFVPFIRGPRLIIDDTGIAFESPLPGFMKALQPSWKYAWHEISKIQLPARSLLSSAHLALEVHAGGRVNRVHLLQGGWRELGATQFPSQGAQTKLRLMSTREALRERIASHVIVRALAVHGINVLADDQPPVESILRTRKGAAITYSIFALLGYAIVDSMLQSEVYFQVPVQLMAGVSLAGLFVAFLALSGTEMKLEERVGLPVVLSFALAFASYPGVARINSLEGEMQMLEFRQEHDLRFEPVSADTPALHMKQFGFYWDEFEPGTVHSIAVREGALGLWVYDAAALREKIYAERE